MRERFRLSEQELGHKIWTIVQLFYRSHAVFREQFESYERKVLDLSRRTGVHRDDLRLNSVELAGLLDLKKLERLRDGYIHELKDLCHLVFRGQDRTDLLDRYVSDIFHEISILKEEHYNVKTYAPLYERDAAEVELKHILDEAHTIFPQKLRHIRYLFGRAEARLEAHLASFRNIPLFLRSLYLHRHDFVAEAYTGGLAQFYRFMYPLGPFEGYYQVGLCFYCSAFEEEALEAFLLAREAYRQLLLEKDTEAPGSGEAMSPGERRRKIHAILRPMNAMIPRLTAALPSRLASFEAAIRDGEPAPHPEGGRDRPRDGSPSVPSVSASPGRALPVAVVLPSRRGDGRGAEGGLARVSGVQGNVRAGRVEPLNG